MKAYMILEREGHDPFIMLMRLEVNPEMPSRAARLGNGVCCCLASNGTIWE